MRNNLSIKRQIKENVFKLREEGKSYKQIAKQLDCKFIEAQSNVPDFESYAVKNGWNLDTRIYRRKVE